MEITLIESKQNIYAYIHIKSVVMEVLMPLQ